jgi:hypothetical protein
MKPCSANAACVSGRSGRSAKVIDTLECAETDAAIGGDTDIDEADLASGNHNFMAT